MSNPFDVYQSSSTIKCPNVCLFDTPCSKKINRFTSWKIRQHILFLYIYIHKKGLLAVTVVHNKLQDGSI